VLNEKNWILQLLIFTKQEYNMRCSASFLLLSLLLSFNVYGQTGNKSKAIISEDFIFPLQNEHVHGSSIVILPDGDTLAVWFQGSGERTDDEGKSWKWKEMVGQKKKPVV
jgi:hypothetical protein